MLKINHIGRYEAGAREIFSIELPGLLSLPDPLSLPSRHFVAFLAVDAIGVDSKVVSEFCRRLIAAGCVYFCVWGSDCERVHDIFDEECFEKQPLIMTTWHTGSLDEALWYFIYSVFPDEGYANSNISALAISVGKPDYADHIKRRLSDLDSFSKDVLG